MTLLRRFKTRDALVGVVAGTKTLQGLSRDTTPFFLIVKCGVGCLEYRPVRQGGCWLIPLSSCFDLNSEQQWLL